MNDSEIGLRIVCPFCPLHCDDVQISEPPKCSILESELARLNFGSVQARVGNQSRTLDEAWVAAKAIISKSEKVLLLVRSATLGQAKAIAGSRVTVATETTPTLIAVSKAIARCGTVTATLADIKQHADAIVVLGDIDSSVPRLMKNGGIGFQPVKTTSQAGSRCHLPKPDADSIAKLATDIRQGKLFAGDAYIAFILVSNAFDASQADVAVELLIKTVIWMNSADRPTHQRAVLLSLDPLASLRCTSAWTDGKRLSEVKESDFDHATIRIGKPTANQPAADIQIGGTDPGPKQAKVYLPASTPGIDHIDAVIRGDSTVTLPLGKIQASTTPSVADWIAKLS
ncbi:hypothetical protein LF1_21940 [Rubripirellula obstinata]|uniref:Formylmethanofuran dehydrogenase subunit B n=1 Tax=Rubripirellula obstinata TaxID=406547 RepID=A0A5B1CIW0_9BACT|nr:hypothetical protein [Rubripirellula obstinata]KAA1259659.1 hypothetical protein LF1_21940 [Rubripirellula obstinata]